jgi:outer membrane protein with beta-barrel domain
VKKLTLSLCALLALGSAAFAGTETYSKESKSVTPPPCPQWYADNEFNLSLSGVYAFTGSEWREDRFLGVDHGWGGAIDAKYFMHRYFGFGMQGFILRVNREDFNGEDDTHAAGGVLGTFTLRFPISCSRFAPYVWVGGGGIWSGRDDEDNVVTGIRIDSDDNDSRAMGQVGGGFEIRFTPHCGLLNDFSWNIVEGTHNNFGMARTGLNFAF